MRQVSRVAREIADRIERTPTTLMTDGSGGLMLEKGTLERWLLMLAPPRKKVVRARDTVPGSRKVSRNQLDKLCREFVFKRDGGKCRKCGKDSGLRDWAHVFSRRHLSVRWDPENSVVLCRKCHLAWHQRPTEGVEWLIKEMGDFRYRGLQARSYNKCGDRLAIALHLEQEMGKL